MNRKLRQFIKRIDDARKPQWELERLMANDKEFAQFTDYMLQVIGFRPNTEESTEQSGSLRQFNEELQDVDAMSDNDKFKNLLKKMLINSGL